MIPDFEDRVQNPNATEAFSQRLRSLADRVEAADYSDAIEALEQVKDLTAAINAIVSERDRSDGAGELSLIFDVSDLLGYFPYNRAPTGIQRVQMEVIAAFLADELASMHLCRFDVETDAWLQVPQALFLELCAASKAGGSAEAEDWLELYNQVKSASRSGGALLFGWRATLVNLGTSWWLPDYFMQIRHLKTQFGLRYVPLIYDMIPAIRPEYCSPDLVLEFIQWLLGVLKHADYFLAISEATKGDLIALAGEVGHVIDPADIGVVPLDADYRSATALASMRKTSVPRPFVLLVSTFEVRKNQLGALDAWRSLINEYGVDKVPFLVLVGKRGFHGDQVEMRLNLDEGLGKKVITLAGIDDAELAGLYRECMFVLYPSLYEGWGLPVTEALSYGKVPLVADNSSLPEAGGANAVYFATGSPTDLVAKLKMLILDEKFRSSREKSIAADFRPRSWRDVAMQMRNHLEAWYRRAPENTWQAPNVSINAYYPISRNNSREMWEGMASMEVFRGSTDWYSVEDWGCWSKASGGVIAATVPSDRAIRLGLQVRGLPNQASTLRIEDDRGKTLFTGAIGQFQERWVFVDLPEGRSDVSLRLLTDRIGTVQGDPRAMGIGLRGIFCLAGEDREGAYALTEAAALGSLYDYYPYRRRW